MTQFIVLTKAQGDAVRGVVVPGHALNPVLIQGGSQAGKYALGVEVLADASMNLRKAVLALIPTAELDPTVAWPAPQI